MSSSSALSSAAITCSVRTSATLLEYPLALISAPEALAPPPPMSSATSTQKKSPLDSGGTRWVMIRCGRTRRAPSSTPSEGPSSDTSARGRCAPSEEASPSAYSLGSRATSTRGASIPVPSCENKVRAREGHEDRPRDVGNLRPLWQACLPRGPTGRNMAPKVHVHAVTCYATAQNPLNPKFGELTFHAFRWIGAGGRPEVLPKDAQAPLLGARSGRRRAPPLRPPLRPPLLPPGRSPAPPRTSPAASPTATRA